MVWILSVYLVKFSAALPAFWVSNRKWRVCTRVVNSSHAEYGSRQYLVSKTVNPTNEKRGENVNVYLSCARHQRADSLLRSNKNKE
ncbi:hypothetical protein OIDMADRAFT_18922 [Oidiodendron maius Zn]|uniref:Secreted protein n=1 Tax=Oidiodendron maius (strain Zn) TaxID=913774 RepID=A0A0C3DK11_OIDMZ|nr:hypothetical protein OIDMADRAFT_18922 [Oidiodendron maius Zn]